MKKCLKCGKEFPVKVVIKEKERNLQRRKFCLSCSPFGSHNTTDVRKPKQTDTARKAANSRAVIKRRREKQLTLVRLSNGDEKSSKCCLTIKVASV